MRADGSVESVVLETRSYLRHDLAHLAVELELGLDDGFFGSVAAGAPLVVGRDGAGRDASGPAPAASASAMVAEQLAARLQTAWKHDLGPDALHDVLEAVAPELISAETSARVWRRMRALQGNWAATRHGTSMVVEWPR